MMTNGSSDPILTVTLESPDDMDFSIANLDTTTKHLLLNGGPLTSVNKSSDNSKNFWTELPQMIVVETRFITEQIAHQNHIYSAQTLLPITDNRNVSMIRNSVAQIATQTHALPIMLDVSTSAKPTVADASVITDSTNPMRERAIQTVKTSKQAVAIGIQCNLEDDLAFAEMFQSNDAREESRMTEKEEFLTYSREMTIFYLNGRRECMVCGEIEISMDRMLSHLAQHWGPSTLCHLCGLLFEHQLLMSSHRCQRMKTKKSKSKKQRKSYKQCPIFWCGTVIGSKQSFNEHLRCHSRKQRPRACVTFSLDRTLVLVRPFKTKLNSLHRCNICLRVCKNAKKFIRHRKSCVSNLTSRLQRQSC